jgi:hypothetical protein
MLVALHAVAAQTVQPAVADLNAPGISHISLLLNASVGLLAALAACSRMMHLLAMIP